MKMVLHPSERNQLKLGHVNRMRLDRAAILGGFRDPVRKIGNVLHALFVFKNLAPVFLHAKADLDIENLARLKANMTVLPARQSSPVDLDLLSLLASLPA